MLHSELGASAASRWMACPGSVAAQRGKADQTSRYAAEGTAAHEVAARCLQHRHPAAFFIGQVMRVKGGFDIEVTAEMAGAVQVYVDECIARSIGAEVVKIESGFNLQGLQPPAAMFGTADFVSYYRTSTLLTVVDLKYGQGTIVEAVDNPQLKYYALGAMLAMDEPVGAVEVVIVQPRAGGIREACFSAVDLLEWAADLMEAARATMAKDAPRNAGPHCKYCRAKASCQALRDYSLAVTQAAFSDDPEVVGENVLAGAELGELLARIPTVEVWLQALQQEAHKRIAAGKVVPGWKLVAGQARRKWIDEDQAASLLDQLGVSEDRAFKRTLVSPAQAEKLLPKDQRDRLSGLAAAVSSGARLAPESDRRPAVQGEAFSALAEDDDNI